MISTICDAEMENLHVRIESHDREEKDGRKKKNLKIVTKKIRNALENIERRLNY